MIYLKKISKQDLPDLQVGQFRYTTSKAGKSSAAVIDNSGVLVKVLWIAQDTSKGTHTGEWDGTDELGEAVEEGTYNVLIKNHNLGYQVKGIIGNNSVDDTGSGVWRGFQFIHDMAFSATHGYYALGYNEGWSSIGKFLVSQPLRKIPILETRQTNAVVHYVCTDGNYTYWSAYDPAIPNKSFVFATRCDTDAEVSFSSATDTSVNHGAPNGKTYKAINVISAEIASSGITIGTNPTVTVSSTANIRVGEFVRFSSITGGSVLAYGSSMSGRTFKVRSIVNGTTFTIETVTTGTSYTSANVGDNTSQICGIAVSSAYTFVSRRNNTITLLNKSTGAVVSTITVSGCGKIAAEGSNLWVQVGTTVKKFTVGSGTLTENSTPITGLTSPFDLKISGSTISVLDNSVVKHFNSSGTQTGTLGSGASYVTDPNVFDNKFYLKASDGYKPFISYQSDGAIWVGDVGNTRVQKFSGSTYVSNIKFEPHNYNVSIEATLGNRTFVDFKEYNTTDLSNPGVCPLVRNYEPSAPAGYNELWHTMEWPITYSNGRTYAWLKHTSTHLTKCFEVPTDGPLRLADTVGLESHEVFAVDPVDFKLRIYKREDTADAGTEPDIVTIKEKAFNGFATADPKWSAPVPVISMPLRNNEPIEGDIEKVPQKTTGGYFINYSRLKSSVTDKFHLGGLLAGDTNFKWLAQLTLGPSYSGDRVPNRFDDANQVNYPGGNVFVIGRFVYTVYKGENWKQSQTNHWDHYSEEGIPLGIFGDWKYTYNVEALPEVAGNVTTGGVILRAGKHYIVHNDESIHGGAMVWEVTGLDTIETIPAFVTTGGATPSPNHLHLSQDEIPAIRQRLKTGPYKSKGDTGRTNSFGDGDMVYKYANQLTNNPLFDYYTGPIHNPDGTVISSSNPVKKNAAPEPNRGNERIGMRLLCAAFLGAVLEDGSTKNSYINAAKTCILNQIDIEKYPNLDFSNTGMWRNTEIGDQSPGFGIAEWLGSFLVAYDYVKSNFTSEQREDIETWILNAANYFKGMLANQNNQYFVDRPNGNYTFTTHPSNEHDFIDYTHDGGYVIKRFNLHWSNRLLSIATFLINAGVFFNNETIIEVGSRFTKEMLVYATYGNGMTGDMERAGGSDKERGVGYWGGQVGNLSNMVSVLGRSGRFDLIDFSTTAGAYGTESPGKPKSIRLTLDGLTSVYCKDKGWKYQGEILDGNLPSLNWYSVLDALMAPANMYYRDEKIRKVMYRTQSGCNPYPTSPAGNGPVPATFGNGCYFPGVALCYFYDDYASAPKPFVR
jgi:hypothetical protein